MPLAPLRTVIPPLRTKVVSASGDMLPKGARVVTVSENLGMNAHGKKPPAPATITTRRRSPRSWR